MSNLKQFGLAIQIYANDYNNKLPEMTSGNWLWDIPIAVMDQMLANGAKRDIMYCPAFPQQNNNILWGGANGFSGLGFRVVGYAQTFPAAPAFNNDYCLIWTNRNPTVLPTDLVRIGQRFPAQSVVERVLAADATISRPNENNEAQRDRNNYVDIGGGWSMVSGNPKDVHRTPHMAGRLPAGGNVVMLDSHAEWRKFQFMRVRTQNTSAWPPVFWW